MCAAWTDVLLRMNNDAINHCRPNPASSQINCWVCCMRCYAGLQQQSDFLAGLLHPGNVTHRGIIITSLAYPLIQHVQRQ